MREDYGYIEVILPPGLSREAKIDLARRQIQNQLFIQDEIRYVYVHAQCLDFVKILSNGRDFDFDCNGFFYTYSFRIRYREEKNSNCLKKINSCK